MLQPVNGTSTLDAKSSQATSSNHQQFSSTITANTSTTNNNIANVVEGDPSVVMGSPVTSSTQTGSMASAAPQTNGPQNSGAMLPPYAAAGHHSHQPSPMPIHPHHLSGAVHLMGPPGAHPTASQHGYSLAFYGQHGPILNPYYPSGPHFGDIGDIFIQNGLAPTATVPTSGKAQHQNKMNSNSNFSSPGAVSGAALLGGGGEMVYQHQHQIHHQYHQHHGNQNSTHHHNNNSSHHHQHQNNTNGLSNQPIFNSTAHVSKSSAHHNRSNHKGNKHK